MGCSRHRTEAVFRAGEVKSLTPDYTGRGTFRRGSGEIEHLFDATGHDCLRPGGARGLSQNIGVDTL